VGVRSARRPDLAAISPNILKIAKTRDGPLFTVRYALQNSPPRARHGVCARDVAGNSRSRCAFASRILGSTDFGSTAIKCHFGFKNKKTRFQIHHIALSANVLFRLTLPRTITIHRYPAITPATVLHCHNVATSALRTRHHWGLMSAHVPRAHHHWETPHLLCGDGTMTWAAVDPPLRHTIA